MLGAQVLLGFQYQAVFQPGFQQLDLFYQYADVAALFLLIVSFGLLLTPAHYHQLVEEGRDTEELERLLSGILHCAAYPFALALGADLAIASSHLLASAWAAFIGGVAVLVSLFTWYGLARRHRTSTIHHHKRNPMNVPTPPGMTSVKQKVEQILIEARVVLPGVQALLGFQFVVVLTDQFQRLPLFSQYVHLASLGLMALAMILLMTPAAYHRVAEEGRDTEHFHRFASRIVLAATLPLAFGCAGDVYVVTQIVTHSGQSAWLVSLGAVVILLGLWFGYPSIVAARSVLFRRLRRRRPSEPFKITPVPSSLPHPRVPSSDEAEYRCGKSLSSVRPNVQSLEMKRETSHKVTD